MLLIRVCQWIKLRIQLITKDPVEVIRAGFRKSDKPSSKIPGIFKGQPYQLSFKLIRSAKRPPMLPSSTLRNLVEHRGVEPLFRMLNRRDSTLWRSLVSHEASADEISATGGHQLKPLSNASHCLRSGTASPCPQMKIGTTVKVIPIIHVEHRGVEPLTSTMRMSRATNCANAPYVSRSFPGESPAFNVCGSGDGAVFRLRAEVYHR